MADDFNFKVNPSDFRGIEHEKFRTRLLNLAITEPTKYNQLRMDVLEKIKEAAVNAQYNIYYYLLTVGMNETNDKHILEKTDSATLLGAQYKTFFCPRVPANVVNEFAMKASATIDKIAEEAINMIMPDDWKDVADKRLYTKTKSNIGFA
jgi:hypothetical protein